MNHQSFIILLVFCSISGSITPDQSAIEDKFIINLVNQRKFLQCSILILEDGFDYGESVSRILASTISPSKLSVRSVYSFKNKVSSTNFTNINITFQENRPLQYKLGISNSRTKSSNCLIAIILISDIRHDYLSQIYKSLSPVFNPILRKDEDFYIFKANVKYHKRLMMKKLPARTKFKIAVGSDLIANESVKGKESVEVRISTVCFFCGRRSKAKLMRLSVTNNLPAEDIEYFPDFVKDLHGKVMKVSFPKVPAKIEADSPYIGERNAKRGKWKLLFDEFLTVKFNCTYNMFLSSGINKTFGRGGTGRLLPNGNWIGVTGDLVSGKADLGIIVASTPNRMMYIDFTDSFYDNGSRQNYMVSVEQNNCLFFAISEFLTFVTAQPTRNYSLAAFLWPFDYRMWICIAFCTLFSICFIATINKFMKYSNLKKKWPFSQQLQFVISTFLEQDTIFPQSDSLRCFVGLWLFFTMILTNVYRCKMVTLLTFPLFHATPKTFGELAFSKYEVGFIKHGDAAYNMLKGSKDPVYKRLLTKMKIFTGDGLECLEKVVEHQKYACIAYNCAITHSRAKNLSESDTRKLVFAPALTYNVWLGLGTELRSIYKANFGRVLSNTRSFHLSNVWEERDYHENVRKLKLEWWKNTNQKEKMKYVEMDKDTLELKHFIGIFYVWGGCLVISGVFFLNEVLTKWKWIKFRSCLNAEIKVEN